MEFPAGGSIEEVRNAIEAGADVSHYWSPITPLSEGERAIDLGLRPLYDAWHASQAGLRESTGDNLRAFSERLVRRMSVETGIIERLYDVDRGTTETLVKEGFDENLVPRSSTDTEPGRLIQILTDHEKAYGLLIDCVNGPRELTVGFVRDVHHAFTLHQDTITAPDTFGVIREIPLRKGQYKEWPNNPRRPDGLVHQYCPPEQVASEMENLLRHLSEYDDLDPVLVSAWMHHRFTQIHPFQDGNGRVARALVALLLMKANLLPIVIDRDMRTAYLDALEEADAGDLRGLADLFAEQERQLIVQALSAEAEVDAEQTPSVASAVIADIGARLRRRQEERTAAFAQVNQVALRLRENARVVVEETLSDLRRSVAESVQGMQGGPVYAERGGPDEGNAHWYRQDVIKSAQDGKTFVNFNEPHYFVKGAFRVGRERLVFVVSFHHVGRELSGVMEATAFAHFESFETSEDPQSKSVDYALCSSGPFVFAYGTQAEDMEESFTEWLDRTLAVAIGDWGRRL